jgi:hypothetical protein
MEIPHVSGWLILTRRSDDAYRISLEKVLTIREELKVIGDSDIRSGLRDVDGKRSKTGHDIICFTAVKTIAVLAPFDSGT